LFVPLKSGRYLYPAKNLGWKIAPTFWWDGFRWHWAGTTASACQLVAILFTSLAPVIVVNLAMFLGLWSQRPDWCHPLILSPIIGLIAIQLTYLAMWDFDFRTRAKDRSQEPSAHN